MNTQLMTLSEERPAPRERRLPRHTGFIPDGNRRWAVRNGLAKERGFQNGIAPGVALFEACKALGIEEVSQSPQFPTELAAFRSRQGKGIKVNFPVNSGWEWDRNGLQEGGLRSADVSRPDLIVRWGGGTRLSGFLPVQSVYADTFVIEALWPDFQPKHLEVALSWLRQQYPTLGG